MLTWKREDARWWRAEQAPVSVYKELDERSHTYLYEVYSTTQFIAAYPTLHEAMVRADSLGWERAS